ncbi:GIY-YIG nuclease family protein [Amycolatopsis magusensis]|uniref:GIY-YIG nuclease family protein n=1 Tax=Amycolatopsis magusensis TaxID=882444 RepID=A0ABS4PWN5_9PSEU|nr:GIY-YIG nuclease family protein [Amycolatopsis magusensis]MBP2183846.1 hypothetical protein [Amycolatopsis magusensis]
MTRPPIRFTLDQAHRIHGVLAGLIPQIGDPGPYNSLGVVCGSIMPKLMPIEDVLDRTVYTELRTAVYVVTDDVGIVRYVGSIDRRTPALRSRLTEHVKARGPATQAAWTRVGMVLVPDGAPRALVQQCEGWVGRVLDPLDNGRLPSVGAGEWTPRARAA